MTAVPTDSSERKPATASTAMDISTLLEELVAARRMLRQVIDQLPAMIGYWDRDLHNRVANRAYMDWFGLAPEEIRGRHIREVIGQELFDLNSPHIQAALAGEAQHFERTIVDVHGVTRHSQASYIPDLAEGGEPNGFFVLVSDISDRVRAERALAAEQQRTQQLADHLRIVSRVSTTLHDLDPATVLESIAQAVLELGYSGSNLAVIDPVTATFVPSYGRGIFTAIDGLRLPITAGVTHEAIAQGGMVVVPDYQALAQAIDAIKATGVRTSVSTPVRTAGTVVAVLHVGLAELREISETDREVLSLLADITGTALANAFTYQEARASSRHFAQIAEIDALTGVGNRLAAERLLDAARPGDVLVLADLDAFKGVNDEHGHSAGDQTLRDFADVCGRGLRERERITRFGGEEFLLFLPTTTLPAADAALHRLRTEWAAVTPLTTFSAGVAQIGPDEAARVAFDRADAALYEAKRTGRDRHVVELTLDRAARPAP